MVCSSGQFCIIINFYFSQTASFRGVGKEERQMMRATSISGNLLCFLLFHGLYEYLNYSLANINFKRSQNQFKCNRILSITVPSKMFMLFVFLTSSPDFYQRLLVDVYLSYIFIPFKEKMFSRQQQEHKTTFHMPSCFSVFCKLHRKQNTLINARKAKRAVFSMTLL